MRTYERTHPWLSFRLDLNQLPADVWMLVGETTSKCEHLAGVPLRPKTAAMLHATYLAKGALGTAAIEGNTLSLEEVEKRIEGKLSLPQSKEYLGREIDNVLRAYQTLFQRSCAVPSSPLTVADLKQFNQMLLDGLELPPEVHPGEIRRHVVGVGRYRGAPPEDCEYLLERMCEMLNDITSLSEPWLSGTPSAILAAVIGHLYLAWIHPFGDGNGRTARLLEFALLLRGRVPTVAAHLLSNFYNDTRMHYYLQLQAASESGGNVVPFVRYALTGFVESLREQIGIVREEQLDVAWRNYVYGAFGEAGTERDRRHRRLVLDLSRQSKPVPREKIPELSVKVMRCYGKKSDKTLHRDLKELVGRGLLAAAEGGYRARKELIAAFLPGRVPETEVDKSGGE